MKRRSPLVLRRVLPLEGIEVLAYRPVGRIGSRIHILHERARLVELTPRATESLIAALHAACTELGDPAER